MSELPGQNIYQSNKEAYRSARIVDEYLAASELQAPEQTILEILSPALGSMRMLDLGVGGGRTTPFFAPRVREYVGVDYSETMIAGCRARFQGTPLENCFRVGDAQSMPMFPDSAFDLVLFSFNGIDVLDPAQRETVYREIRRVCDAGSYFCFSSHNLGWLRNLNLKALPRHPLKFLNGLWKIVQLRALNYDYWPLRDDRIAVIREPERPLRQCFISASMQCRHLLEAGFSDARVFDLSGRELSSPFESVDPWLYYLCRVREA